MKRYLCLLSLCLVLFQPCTLLADEQPLPVNVKESMRKATASLGQLTREQREAALSEVFGLLFMPDGKSAYKAKTSYERIEVKERGKVVSRAHVPYHSVWPGAQFAGSDGKLYDFYAALPARGSSARKKEAWTQAKLYIHYAGKPAIRDRYAAELEQLELQRGVHFLRQMAPLMRQAFFAEVLGLLYMENGGEALLGESGFDVISGEKVPFRRVDKWARFVDAEGYTHGYFEVKENKQLRGEAWPAWWLGAKLAIHHLGPEKVLAPFAEEIRAMEKRHAARASKR